MKNDCHLFKSGYLEVLMFLKTDIDIDIPNICLMFGSEERRGEDRGKGGCVGANISKQSPAQPSVLLSLAWLAWLLE